ncbi:hypothetical protein SAMN05443575_3676 [Jatrophihabitans endophyticus]|uniref:Copper(I)-binding protein n=1 Tax=Jatrophihabitans endophyticus TaxID=1206085 RepID=A0A1M5RXA0_9ACTN|nr:copper chaperone PCu(A)C [Jatrophihabitans endophyticus]SHH30854.1 hypothetical protein SAMN05443575_3676 [Jatrophihabitans endophyticus]
MRLPWPALAGGTLVLAVGAAGLVRGAVPQSAAADSGPADVDPITVTGAYVRPPVPPTKLAAAYFAVRNNTGTPDELTDVTTGAGADATLHTLDSSGAMSATGTAVIPAHGRLVLSPGKGHLMIGKLFGTLRGGDEVNISLQFQSAGSVDVVARVIPYDQPAPTGAPK